MKNSSIRALIGVAGLIGLTLSGVSGVARAQTPKEVDKCLE